MELLAMGLILPLSGQIAPTPAADPATEATLSLRHEESPRTQAARRFLAQRGVRPGELRGRGTSLSSSTTAAPPATVAAWQPIGPAALSGTSYGLVSGRVSALALDPADASGNRLFVGTTGGGVWAPKNLTASAPASLQFAPLTDTISGLSSVADASLSIGALTVQPGGTGVILAGTGDPNDALDSYYGAGILRSADGGATWSPIVATADQYWSFLGEGFAGFAWSTVSTNTVVAAVSQAYEGVLVDAVHANISTQGLYYSTDAGATWHLSTITDGAGQDVQGPNDSRDLPDGNAATAVVWNPQRNFFLAAVRFHGYYQSADGITFTRLSAQPGTNLTPALCPTNLGQTGSTGCPIFRGALAVNPYTGDSFAWSTDLYNQDQGLWRDVCNYNGKSCTNTSISFATQIGTTALESNTDQGAATIANGDYTLSLATVPWQLSASADTILLAGGVDLWKCSLAMGCVWRNTTNTATCRSAQVGSYQHALVWNASNPNQIYIGNDSGLWVSTDQIGESGAVCDASDSTHFQNLNGGLGSLAEVENLAQSTLNPYSMMAGLGGNGTAGVNGWAAPAGDWPQILTGEGGPAAIDAASGAWYVNNGIGVSILQGSPAAGSPQASFSAVLNASTVPLPLVVEDGFTMGASAAFLIDPLDSTQLLIATCRLWRGPASGSGWTAANAVSNIFDGGQNAYCSGNALVRSLAAMALANGTEVVAVGFYNSANGGATLAGHVLSAILDPTSSTPPTWTDLTLNAVSNDSYALNYYNFDISSIVFDPHDATGQTIYVTIEGMSSNTRSVIGLYRSTDGGSSWTSLQGNLPATPVSGLVVDPQNGNTVYIATDLGVYATRQIGNCTIPSLNCWSLYGTGLPMAPVTALAATGPSATAQLLTAATYGRGLWQIAPWTADETPTTASVAPVSLTFSSQAQYTTSAAQTVMLTNTGSNALSVIGVGTTGDFIETDNCQSAAIAVGGTCPIQLSFSPKATGSRSGQLVIAANIAGGDIIVPLSGTGSAPLTISLSPDTWNFGGVEVNGSSSVETITVSNSGTTTVNLTGQIITPPFAFVSSGTTCGTSLAAGGKCYLAIDFAPTTAATFSGTLTLSDDVGSQTAILAGQGLSAPTDVLNPSALTFAATPIGQTSAMQLVTLTNSGGAQLSGITVSISGPFQYANYCGATLMGSTQTLGESCSIGVVYSPTAAASQSGLLTVADELRTQMVSLTGTGEQSGAISVSPISLTFGPQAVGTTSAAQTLTITNTGGAAISYLSFSMTGDSTGSFATGLTTCGVVLAGGASCTVQVSFTPQSSVGVTATLVLTSTTNGVGTVSVPLSGNGGVVPASIVVSTNSIAFGMIDLGQVSAVSTVTISNPGSVDSVQALTIPSPGSGFLLVNNTCGATLTAQSSCTVGVEYAPTVAGAQSATLTIFGNSGSSPLKPATILLAASGFTFSLSVDYSSLTVTSGGTATYTLTITPQGVVAGSSISFSIACGEPPTNTICTPNPSSESLAAAGTAQVLVATGVSTAWVAPLRLRPVVLPELWGIFALPLAWRLRRARRKLLLTLLFGLGTILLVVGISGCTSSGGGTGGGGSSNCPATTPCSIPVTVTATNANNLSQVIDLNLVVD